MSPMHAEKRIVIFAHAHEKGSHEETQTLVANAQKYETNMLINHFNEPVNDFCVNNM